MVTRQITLFSMQQIPLVEIGLAIHDSKISDGLRPFQQKMEDMFVKRKEMVEEKYGKKVRPMCAKLICKLYWIG